MVDLFEDHHLHVLILTETWHEDSDSVTIKRLHGSGLNVVEAACPITGDSHQVEANFVNHGGLAIVSRRETNIGKVTTRLKLTTFEHLWCWIVG